MVKDFPGFAPEKISPLMQVPELEPFFFSWVLERLENWIFLAEQLFRNFFLLGSLGKRTGISTIDVVSHWRSRTKSDPRFRPGNTFDIAW